MKPGPKFRSLDLVLVLLFLGIMLRVVLIPPPWGNSGGAEVSEGGPVTKKNYVGHTCTVSEITAAEVQNSTFSIPYWSFPPGSASASKYSQDTYLSRHVTI